MRNKLLTSVGVLVAALCLLPVNLDAQTQKSARVLYFDDVDECFGGDFHAISPNGRYAVGFSPEFTEQAYMWDKETGKVIILSEGAVDGMAEAYGVSDDGTVAGNFTDPNSLDSNGKPAVMPGYWKNGKWNLLPRLEGMPISGSGMSGAATGISADGKIICGYIPPVRGKFAPALWIDGILQPVPEEELVGQGNAAFCFAQEGKIIGGWAEHEDGSRSPAVFIDGKTTRIDGLISPTESPDDEFDCFFDGVAQNISENGKYVAGYFSPTGDAYGCKPFIWTQEKGTEYILEAGMNSIITNDKTMYGTTGFMGSAYIYKDGVQTDLTEYIKNEYNFVPNEDFKPMSCPLGVSTDGKTIAGWSATSMNGVPMMNPMIIILEETTSIVENNTESVSIRSTVVTGSIQIDGQYQAAQIYDSVGKLVLTDNSLNGTISTESLENGIYFVKIANGNQTQTFKVMKK